MSLGLVQRDTTNVIRSLLAPVVFFLPFYMGLPEGYEVLAVILIYVVIGDSNYILHLHIHRPFSRNRAVNLLLDLCLGSVTGMTASNWRIQHKYGHHCGIDILFRGGGNWELEKYTPLRALSFCFRSILVTFWRPIVLSFQNGVLANKRRPINYRWAFAEQCLLVMFVILLAFWNLKIVLLYVLPLYGLTYFISRYVDYLNHYGCDERSDNVYEHANNSLNWLFNRVTHNFGYHTAHHLRPGAHWTKLPAIHARIENDIPQHCKKPFSWSWMLLPYHFYLSWSGRM